MRGPRARWTLCCTLLALALCAAWVWRAPLGRATLALLIDVPTGGRISFERVALGRDGASFEGVRFDYEGVPLLRVRSARLRYRLRDLLPGGRRRFGLVAIRLDGPRIVLERRADRTFVLPGGAASGAPSNSATTSPGGAPLDLTATVRDGSLLFLDAARVLPGSRRFALAHIALDAAIDATQTRYRMRGELAGVANEGFSLRGRIDALGSADHRLRASALPLRDVANYFINTPAAAFESATLHELDLHAYAFASGGRPGAYHFAGSAMLAAGRMHVPGLVPEATGLHGRIDLFDEGIASPELAAELGPVHVRMAGGLYGWSAPAFRLGVVGGGELRRLRGLFRFSRALPLAGRIAIRTLLEGPVSMPLVATGIAAPRVRYAAFPIEDAGARALYYAQSLAIVGARGRYGGFDVATNGSLDLGQSTQTRLVLAAAGGTSRVPYLAAVAPGSRISAQALLAGSGLRFDVRGALGDSGGATRFGGLFHVDPAGDGNLGPFAFARADGASLEGTFYLRRSASESGLWLAARDYRVGAAPQTAGLPGVALTAPDVSGRLSGSLVGVGPPSQFRVAGRALGAGMRVGTLALDEAAADLAGVPGGVRLAHVRARGPWGRFTGRGAYTGQRLALEGLYDGDFTKLATLTGDLGAAGPVSGPVAVLVDSRRTVVQARGTSAAGSSFHGLPLGHVSGTLTLERGALRVYGATAAVAGGTAAAAGVLGPASRLAVSLADADTAGAVRVARLRPGRLTAVGTLAVRGRGAEFDGGVAVRDGRFAGVPFAGNADVALRTAELRIARADATLGSTVGAFAGTVVAPGAAAQTYALHVTIPAAPLGPVAAMFAPQVPYLVGTGAADLRLRGRPARLRLDGTLGAPEGSLNGLAFGGFHARVRVDAGGFDARAGRVDVGSTRTNFAASYRGGQASLLVDAPQAELADFNDFFDAGDTLAGAGRVRARFTQGRAAVSTSADVAIAALRFRRFELGNATARWTSSGQRVRGRVAFEGPSGSLETAGTLELAPQEGRLIAAFRFLGTARLAGLDLGVWLPALGYQLPLAGRLDARATISGPLGDPSVETTATLANGSIGAFPVDRLVVRASSTLRRTTLERAEVQLPSLDAVMSGSFGLRDRDPLALAVHVASTDLGALATRLSLGGLAASGAAQADVKIDGTRGNPRVTGGFDVARAAVHGVSVPLAHGRFSLHGRDVVLSGVEVDFATGSLVLAGSVPLQIAPFGFGPREAQIALEASANAIDLQDFAPLLPAGSVLAGRIDGRVGIGGTAGAPHLAGGATLAAGSLRTPAETIPLTALEGRLAFEGNTVRLSGLRAKAGGGTLSGSGTATLPDIVHPGQDAIYAFEARAARATLNFPAYGGGQLDGTLRFARAAGALPLVRGNVSLSEAAIPFSTLLGGAGPAAAASEGAALPSVALDVDLIADRNVRVRSANVDIGARGSIHAGGTLQAPVLAGGFISTGGTLAYFNTVFRLLDGTVTFRPDLGVIPTLDARATTHVIDSDPNTVRNAAGSADITLAVAGRLNALSLTLSSNPAYDRQQILGLLLDAPAFGATNLFGDTAQSPTYYGSTNTAQLSPQALASRNGSGEISVAQEAFGVANAEFTRTLLAPFETTFAGALGLSNFNVNVDYTGNVGLSARKVLGKDINAIYDTSFGYPYRQTFGFEIKPNAFEAAQVTVFQTLGAYDLNSLAPTGYITSLNSKVRTAQPEAGSSGFSLSIQRLFP